MPHKRNPIGCEQITGLARLIRTNALAAVENVALWHERDISHSSVERVILPRQLLRARSHGAAALPASSEIWSSTRIGCWRISNGPAASCSRGACCWSWPETRNLAGRGLRVGPTLRDARRTTSGLDFKTLLLDDLDVMGVLARVRRSTTSST